MYITDFAAIEARVVMWLAGETVGLKMFAEKDADPTVDDIYVQMAKRISPTATRQLGKQAVLGCGFGMGVEKFTDTCVKYSVDVTADLAWRAVDGYRKIFSKVPKFWYAMEDAARQTIVNGKPHKVGSLEFYIDGDFMRLRLPAGRTIVYHHPRVDADGSISFMAVNSITNKYEREQIWGGKLVENAVQATARDIMVAGMFGLLRAGYKILFTVHDELVVEHTAGSCEEVKSTVCVVPTWAKGCPINAECESAERYRK
jgi:DNA polymerase